MSLVGNSFLVEGTQEQVEPLIERLGEDGIDVRGSTDSYVRTYMSFGVDEARELRDRAQTRGLSQRRVFIIATPSLTGEAQNALLKVLEEPPAGALFFLIVPSPAMLLPTLRSRMQTLLMAPAGLPMRVATQTNSPSVDAKRFLAASPEARLEMLKPLLEKDADDRRDMSAVLAFLASLEKKLEKHPDGLRVLYRTRKYAADRGALLKPLLESLALLAPVVR
jgi:DNA polymerase III delta prime subunit